MSTQNHNSSEVYILTTDSDSDLLAIADKHSLQVVDEMRDQHGLYLARIDNRLSLQALIDNSETSICVDFISAQMNHRLKQGVGKNQALAKAIGLNKRADLKIVDATAGLGRDAYIMASLGCDVLMIERSMPVSELLFDGLKRGEASLDIVSIIARLSLVVDDSINYLKAPIENPDVVYLDPMFPERKKSAKVKKEMQLLQRLHGAEQDDETLLRAARTCAKQRVVVKRPKGAPPFGDAPPSHVIETKKMRYDVYMCLG